MAPVGLLAYAASVATVHRWRPVAPPSAAQVETGAPPSVAKKAIGDRLVHKALKNLAKPATLSKSELVALLPAILAFNRAQANGPVAHGELAPLDNAQALREVLIAAIEQLKPAGGPTGAHGPEMLQHDILHLAYVERRPVAYILNRFSISEANYQRNRKEAVSALARHLQSQEALIRSDSAKVPGTE